MNTETDLQAKYADKVTPEHVAAMRAIVIARVMLNDNREQYEALITAKRHMDNVGFITDPTLYRDALASKSLAEQLKLAEAALRFLNDTEIKDDK